MNRLQLIASLTKGYCTLADIGSDHGYVVIDSVKNYGISHAYACDINILPLENAKKNILKNHLENQIELILCNGLKNVPTVDVIIISGMGGILIKDILENDFDKAKAARKLILQANNELHELRKYLNNKGFLITNEHNCYDKRHYYEIIECYYTGEIDKLSEMDLLFGPFLRFNKNSYFVEYYQKKLKIFKSNLSYAQGKESLSLLHQKIALIESALKE